MNNAIQFSRNLAYLLRHSSLPDRRGWVKIQTILDKLSVSLQALKQIVDTDDKGRFEFSEDNFSVRALYGHSINVDLGLTPSMPPAILYHGTADKYIESIMREGIKARKRNFVHLSETKEMAVHVGSRHGVPIVLSVDTEDMVLNRYNFYKAMNGVWLTKEIPVQFIKI